MMTTNFFLYLTGLDIKAEQARKIKKAVSVPSKTDDSLRYTNNTTTSYCLMKTN